MAGRDRLYGSLVDIRAATSLSAAAYRGTMSSVSRASGGETVTAASGSPP
jgi:hypothetical protein